GGDIRDAVWPRYRFKGIRRSAGGRSLWVGSGSFNHRAEAGTDEFSWIFLPVGGDCQLLLSRDFRTARVCRKVQGQVLSGCHGFSSGGDMEVSVARSKTDLRSSVQ